MLLEYIFLFLSGIMLFIILVLVLRKKKNSFQQKNYIDQKELLPTGQILLRHNYKNRSLRDFLLDYSTKIHSYSYKGTVLTYVGDAVNCCFPKFDEEQKALQKAYETGKETDYIKEEWASEKKEAEQLGSFVHRQIENFLLGKNSQSVFNYHYEGCLISSRCPISIIPEMNQFATFWAKKSWKPYRSQWIIFDEDLGLVGIVDLLAHNEKNDLLLCDWTRSRKIGTEVDGKYVLQREPKSTANICQYLHLADTPFNRKALQLNVLRAILKKRYDLFVNQMFLVVFHAENEKFHELQIPLLEAETESFFQNARDIRSHGK